MIWNENVMAFLRLRNLLFKNLGKLFVTLENMYKKNMLIKFL